MSQGSFDPSEPNNNNSIMRGDESSNSSIMATMNTFVKAVNEMDDTILVPSRLLDMNPQSKEDPQAVIPMEQGANGANTDMFAFFQMLNAIKSELVQGPNSDEEEEEEGAAASGAQDDQSKQVAKAFRHHLKGLFGVLKQLTGTAKFLTSRYQEDIDIASNSGPASLSSFTL